MPRKGAREKQNHGNKVFADQPGFAEMLTELHPVSRQGLNASQIGFSQVVPLSPSMDFKVERALRVFPQVIAQWQKREVSPPEERLLPASLKPGSLEHAQALWLFMFGNRHGGQADTVIRYGAMIADSPRLSHLMDPLRYPYDRDLTEEEWSILTKVIPMSSSQTQRINIWWKEGLRRIRDEYQGDIRNLFLKHADNRLTPTEVRERIIQEGSHFVGVKHKLINLLGTWFRSVEWEDHQGEWAILRQKLGCIAVDIWLLRVLYQWEILDRPTHLKEYAHDIERLPKSEREQLAKPLSDIITRMCEVLEWDIDSLSQGLWNAGAKLCAAMRRRGPERAGAICLRCPGNPYCTRIVPVDDRNGGYLGFHLARPRPATLFSLVEDIN